MYTNGREGKEKGLEGYGGGRKDGGVERGNMVEKEGRWEKGRKDGGVERGRWEKERKDEGV